MNAYVTYSVGKKDMDLVFFLSQELSRKGVRPYFGGSYVDMISGDVVSRIMTGDIVIVLITKSGEDLLRIRKELIEAKKLEIPAILIIEKGVDRSSLGNFHFEKVIDFDRSSIDESFLKDLKSTITGNSSENIFKSETAAFWLLGGLAIYGLFNELYENEKPKRKKKSSSK